MRRNNFACSSLASTSNLYLLRPKEDEEEDGDEIDEDDGEMEILRLDTTVAAAVGVDDIDEAVIWTESQYCQSNSNCARVGWRRADKLIASTSDFDCAM